MPLQQKKHMLEQFMKLIMKNIFKKLFGKFEFHMIFILDMFIYAYILQNVLRS
jgi:hypothetical protein